MANWTEVIIAYPRGDEDSALVASSGLPLHPVGNRLERMLAGAVKSLDEGAFLLRVASQTWDGEPQIFIRPEGGEFSVVRWIDIINFLDDTFERIDPEYGGGWDITGNFSAAEVAEHAAIIHVEFLQKHEAAHAEAQKREEYVRSIIKVEPPAWLAEKSGEVMPRTAFDALSAEDQWTFIRSGGVVTGERAAELRDGDVITISAELEESLGVSGAFVLRKAEDVSEADTED